MSGVGAVVISIGCWSRTGAGDVSSGCAADLSGVLSDGGLLFVVVEIWSADVLVLLTSVCDPACWLSYIGNSATDVSSLTGKG